MQNSIFIEMPSKYEDLFDVFMRLVPPHLREQQLSIIIITAACTVNV